MATLERSLLCESCAFGVNQTCRCSVGNSVSFSSRSNPVQTGNTTTQCLLHNLKARKVRSTEIDFFLLNEISESRLNLNFFFLLHTTTENCSKTRRMKINFFKSYCTENIHFDNSLICCLLSFYKYKNSKILKSV